LGRNLPSLLQAATKVSKQATMATVKTDSLILVVVVLRKGYTAEVSATMRFVLYGNFFEASNEVALLRQGLGPAYFHPIASITS
jgi:hypothetical protein